MRVFLMSEAHLALIAHSVYIVASIHTTYTGIPGKKPTFRSGTRLTRSPRQRYRDLTSGNQAWQPLRKNWGQNRIEHRWPVLPTPAAQTAPSADAGHPRNGS